MGLLKHTLPNGLTIIGWPISPLSPTVLALSYSVGSGIETPSQSGYTHLLEHLSFNGCPSINNDHLFTYCEDEGVSLNALTSRIATTFLIEGSRQKGDYLSVLHGLTQDTTLTSNLIDSEASVVEAEAISVAQNATETLLSTLMYHVYQQQSYARPVLGSRYSVQAATIDDLRAFRKQHYHGGNATLIAAGNIDFDLLCRQAEDSELAQIQSPPSHISMDDQILSLPAAHFTPGDQHYCWQTAKATPGHVHFALGLKMEDRQEALLLVHRLRGSGYEAEYFPLPESGTLAIVGRGDRETVSSRLDSLAGLLARWYTSPASDDSSLLSLAGLRVDTGIVSCSSVGSALHLSREMALGDFDNHSSSLDITDTLIPISNSYPSPSGGSLNLLDSCCFLTMEEEWVPGLQLDGGEDMLGVGYGSLKEANRDWYSLERFYSSMNK